MGTVLPGFIIIIIIISSVLSLRGDMFIELKVSPEGVHGNDPRPLTIV